MSQNKDDNGTEFELQDVSFFGKNRAKTYRPFILKDNLGDNYVDKIEPINDGFKLTGRNCKNEPRYINIMDDGTKMGHSGAKLGVVEKQMYDRRVEIFAHFEKELPLAHQPSGVGAKL